MAWERGGIQDGYTFVKIHQNVHLTSILSTSCKLYLNLKTESLITQHNFSFIMKAMFVYIHAEKDLKGFGGGGIMGIFPFFKEPSLLLIRIFPPFPHGWYVDYQASWIHPRVQCRTLQRSFIVDTCWSFRLPDSFKRQSYSKKLAILRQGFKQIFIYRIQIPLRSRAEASNYRRQCKCWWSEKFLPTCPTKFLRMVLPLVPTP